MRAIRNELATNDSMLRIDGAEVDAVLDRVKGCRPKPEILTESKRADRSRPKSLRIVLRACPFSKLCHRFSLNSVTLA
jgi:hypothetical protein